MERKDTKRKRGRTGTRDEEIHVVRMGERRKPKQIMEARTEGRRGRGRPRKAYIDNIEDIARKTGKGIGEMKRMARNREVWSKWIGAAPTL